MLGLVNIVLFPCGYGVDSREGRIPGDMPMSEINHEVRMKYVVSANAFWASDTHRWQWWQSWLGSVCRRFDVRSRHLVL